MKHACWFLLCLLLAAPAVRGQSCACPQSLTRLSELLKRNYAGYADKLTPRTAAAHQQLFEQLQAQAARATGEAACVAVLKKYLRFWADDHLYLTGAAAAPGAAPPAVYPLDKPRAQAYFEANQTRLHPVEGFWTIDDAYQLAIVRRPTKPRNTFVGVVMEAKNPAWKPGMVKLTLRPAGGGYYDLRYTAGDFSTDSTQAVLQANVLDVFRVGQLQKTYPTAPPPSAAVRYVSPFPQSAVEFRFPDDSTAVLMLQSFDVANKTLVDSLLTHHQAALRARPNWIIDVRHNAGGGTSTYAGLLPYLATGPIVRSGSRYRLSPDNVRNYEGLLALPLPPPVKAFFARMVAQGKAQPDTWAEEPGDTLRFATVQPNPRRVAILANRQTFSSAEILLLDARQSRKVTLFGENSGGVVDYGDGTRHALSCDGLEVSIPVRRSNYLDSVRYDGAGIAPDVRIPATERDWQGFVRRYCHNMPGARPRAPKR
ncbi:hypothetical protein FY528_10575 [Hymenobacter lutimineralis]|uniref:Tail specific protease domain-containing protein n=1 Tax=Hymenobacter lutimineralis TaxID=2606448 RepID=A0A5D6V4X0_9BACT|nr:S41 family peptidase [Hymenobacter lutimineralis]TYZ09674.1 hypothetical protein FY528_10575 [Hymenobacter lutimineralis]